jgi:hypothetical protein
VSMQSSELQIFINKVPLQLGYIIRVEHALVSYVSQGSPFGIMVSFSKVLIYFLSWLLVLVEKILLEESLTTLGMKNIPL